MFKRIRSIFVSLSGGRILALLRNVFIIPILINVWGLSYYGEWVLISSMTSILSMTNVGLGTAGQILIVNFLSAKDEKKSYNTLFSVMFIVFVLFLIILLIEIIIYFSGYMSYKLISHELMVLIFLTTSYFINLISKPLRGYWIHAGKYNVSAKYDNLQGLLELACLTLLPLIGLSALGVSIGMITVNLFWTSWYFIQSKRFFNIKLDISFNVELFKVILNKGMGFQFSALWQAILYQAPLWVIAAQMGPSYVGIWGSLRAFTRIGNQVIELLSLAMGAEFQLLLSQQKFKKVIGLLTYLVPISFIISFLAFLFLAFFGNMIYSHWIGLKYHLDVKHIIWTIMGIDLVLFAIWRIFYEIPVAMNKPWQLNLFGVVFSVVTCLVTYFTIKPLGLLGVAVGNLMFDLLMMLFLPVAAMSILGITDIRQLKVVVSKNYLTFKEGAYNRRIFSK